MPADLHLVRVARRVELAEGVVGLTLESVDGTLPPWAPGAHIDLVLPSGIVRRRAMPPDPITPHLMVLLMLASVEAILIAGAGVFH